MLPDDDETPQRFEPPAPEYPGYSYEATPEEVVYEEVAATVPATVPATARAPRRGRRRRWPRILVSLLVLFALLVGGGALWASHGLGGTKAGKTVTIVIPKGATTKQIGDLLARNHVIRSALLFGIVARFRGVQKTLQPGAYVMREGLGVSKAIDLLKRGVALKVEKFTVPEGKTFAQIADIVGTHTHITAASFLAELKRTPAPPIRPNNPNHNFEGLLFPDTYQILEKTTAADLVRMMRANFDARAAKVGLDAGARARGITPYQAVVVASLIEREAKIAKDRALISSVIYNRLRIGMRLQIDATVQYAIMLKTGNYKGTLLQKTDYTSVKSPYNTYLNDGLPPAPIANPGEEALRAAIAPAKTSYLYYVLCDTSGGHAFASSGAQFNSLVRRCASVPH
jgi:UPF0755 protein